MVFDLEQGERYNDKAVAELQAECGALQNSLQQLKTEIAAHADLFEHELNLPIENAWQVAHDAIVFMRQLSAV